MPGEIFVAKDGACISTPDGEYYIVQGKTTIRAGHPLHIRNPHLWEPLKVDFDIQQAPPPPADDEEEKDEEEPARGRTVVEEQPVVKSASPRTQGARTRVS